MGGRAPDGSGVDGRGRLLHVRAGLGRQRVVLRPAHRRRAPAHPPRRLRREVPRRGRRGGRLRAGRLPPRTRPGHRCVAPARHQRDRRHELVACQVGGGSGRRSARRPPLAHRQARDLRMAGRTLQRARRGRLLAQPDPHPRRRRPSPGVVAGRVAHRLVQRRRRRVRARDRRPGRVEPAPDRDRRAVLLLPPGVVAGRDAAGLHQHPLPGAGPRPGVGRHRAHRHRPLRPPRALDEPRLVAGLPLARLRPPARQPAARDLRPRHRIGRDAPVHRRHVRRDLAGLGRVRQVPLLPGLHRLRAQHRLAGHDLVRPPGDARTLPRAPQRRRALALPAAER